MASAPVRQKETAGPRKAVRRRSNRTVIYFTGITVMPFAAPSTGLQ